MKTFEERYCEATGCAAEDFSRKIFWTCLHRHAVPVAPVILFINYEFLSLDRELIAEVRKAEKMNQVWEEVRQYFVSPKHEGLLRRKANIRLSARRLINLARNHLPASGPPPAAPSGVTRSSHY